MKLKTKPNYYHIGSLEKGINILRILAAGGAMPLEQIASRSQMDRSGCHRYLLTFRDLGILSKEEKSGYRLTTSLFEIAMSYINQMGIRQIARPFMEELTLKYNETANLVVRNGANVVFLNKIDSSHQYRMEIAIGTSHPIYCTAQGKAIIAFRPENERDAFCAGMKNLKAYSSKTIADPEAFKVEMAEIRKRGFAFNQEEYFAGMSGVAAPILDYTGFAVYSISVAGPSERMPKALLIKIGKDLKQVCEKISADLGRIQLNP